MLRTRSRAALATLLLAVLGAAALASADVLGAAPTGEQVLLWLTGWVLLVWAAVLGVATTVRLVRAGRRADAALAVLGLACVAAVALLHPLAGSGGGAA